MNELNFGDVVWFFWTDCGRYVFENEITGIFPDNLYLEHGKIVGLSEKKDYVHVYIDGERNICVFGYCFYQNYFFDSKELAIEYMQKRINQIEKDM